MFFFGRRKPQLKLEPKQEVELELVSPDYTVIENYFTRVLVVDRKKVTVQVPMRDRQPVQVNVGQSVTVTYWNGDLISSFQSTITDRRDRELDIELPKDINEEKTPDPRSDFTLEIPVPVEYRAVSTAHLQTAVTKAITQNGIHILTNVQIPPGTSLHVELEIPQSPAIKTRGKVLKSQKLAADQKKNLTELEYEDISAEDRNAVFRYAIYFQQRQVRRSRYQQMIQANNGSGSHG